MVFEVSYVYHRAKKVYARSRYTLRNSRLSLGADRNCDIFLPYRGVAHQHATISFDSNKKILVNLNRRWGLLPLRSRTLSLGLNQDYAIAPGIRLSVDVSGARERRFTIVIAINSDRAQGQEVPVSISQLSISLKKVSWVTALVALAITLLLPLSSNVPVLRNFSHTDTLWSSGPLHPAHQSSMKNCNTCHTSLFTPVADNICADCHDNSSDYAHAHIGKWAHNYKFAAMRCIDCHEEHNEPRTLVNASNQLCTNCHADMSIFANSDMPNISNFASHPQFKPTLLRWQDESWHSMTAEFSETLRERSNLKFSHADHLRNEGLETLDGLKILACGDCHVRQSGGELFEPIEMEKHCASCHKLEYAPHDPTRKRNLPHGDPKIVVQMLEEFTTASAVNAAREVTPGKTQTAQKSTSRLSARLNDTLVQALQPTINKTTELLATELIERQLCATCHDVAVNAAKNLGERWTVTPVKLAQQWFESARFDHLKHRQVACLDCHNANQSNQSSDILIPDIANCRGCHADTSHQRQVSSSCISCHQYHEQSRPLLISREEISSDDKREMTDAR